MTVMTLDGFPVHAVIYGLTGSGKTSLAATAQIAGPQLVICADSIIKAVPYFSETDEVRMEEWEYGTFYEGYRDGKLVVRVELYDDEEPEKPTAYKRLLARLSQVRAKDLPFASIILDTLSSFELLARKWHQHDLNKLSKEPRQWHAGATDLLETLINQRFAAMPQHVLILTHVDEDKDEVHGTYVRHPKAPGRLRTRLGEKWEIIRAYVDDAKDKNKSPNYWLQTRKREGYYASLQRRNRRTPPDPMRPHFSALAGEGWEA